MRSTIPHRFFLTLALFATLLAAPFGQARGQWVQTNGFWSGEQVTGLGSSGPNLILGMADGCYVSTDSGMSWTKSGGPASLTSFVTMGNYLFGISNYIDVYLSTDNGINWRSTNSEYYMNSDLVSLAVSGNYLFVGTSDNGIWISTDKCESWSSVSNGLAKENGPYNGVEAIAVMGTYLFAGMGGAGVYRSTNNGESWQPVDSCISWKYFGNSECSSLSSEWDKYL